MRLESDATRVVFNIQRQAGIDLPTDGELYRFDVNHPDTNGMIEYFISPMEGVRTNMGRSRLRSVSKARSDGLPPQSRPALSPARSGEGGLNLITDCEKAASVAGGPFKFTVTSPTCCRARCWIRTMVTLAS